MKKNKKPIYIALGANLSNPKRTFQETFQDALRALEARGVQIRAVSGLWQSPAWPAGSGQPDYINACAEIEYTGDAQNLLKTLHAVESDFGRIRITKNAARTLDLDLLDFRGMVLETQDICLPHPRMLQRGFVLLPLSQIAPDWLDPLSQRPLWSHLERLSSKDILPMHFLGRWV